MRLSGLHTEELIPEAGGIFKNLQKYASTAMGKAKRVPNLREIRIKKIIRETFQEVWGDYHEDPKAIARLEAYKNSIVQHMPKFLKMRNEDQLRHEIEMLFRSRAERVPYSL